MKCELCSNEAVYASDCLVIKNTVKKDSVISGRTITTNTLKTQSVTGVQKVALCEECLKKQIKQNTEHFSSIKTGCLLFVLGFVGMILITIGLFGMDVDGGIPALRIIGTIMFLGCSITSVLMFTVIGPRQTRAKLRETPYYVLHKVRIKPGTDMDKEGETELLVPIGRNYYSDKKEFDNVNYLLLQETSNKIYNTIISTGMRESMIDVSPQIQPADDTPKTAVNRSGGADETLMVYLDIDKLGGGVYGYEAGKAIARAVPATMLTDVSIASGDSNATLYGSANEYVVGLTGSRAVLESVKDQLLSDKDLKDLLSASGIRIGGASEPLVSDGSVQNGTISGGNSWCAQGFRDTWKKDE